MVLRSLPGIICLIMTEEKPIHYCYYEQFLYYFQVPILLSSCWHPQRRIIVLDRAIWYVWVSSGRIFCTALLFWRRCTHPLCYFYLCGVKNFQLRKNMSLVSVFLKLDFLFHFCFPFSNFIRTSRI